MLGVRAYSFPANKFDPPGILNSFTNRIADSVTAWHNDFARSGITLRVAFPGNFEDVQLRYEDIGGPGSTTYTMRSGSSNSCFVTHQSTPDDDILLSVSRIDLRTDWFSQDNSRRSLWESCESDAAVRASEPYTCSKRLDVGSTIIHELGHALGNTRDVADVDNHQENVEASTEANCSNKRTLATMCGISYIYSTARRTLDNWDSTSMRLHYQLN